VRDDSRRAKAVRATIQLDCRPLRAKTAGEVALEEVELGAAIVVRARREDGSSSPCTSSVAFKCGTVECGASTSDASSPATAVADADTTSVIEAEKAVHKRDLHHIWTEIGAMDKLASYPHGTTGG